MSNGSNDFLFKSPYSFCLPYYIPVPLITIHSSSLRSKNNNNTKSTPSQSILEIFRNKYGTLYNDHDEAQEFCVKLVEKNKIKLILERNKNLLSSEFKKNEISVSSTSLQSTIPPVRRHREENDHQEEESSISIHEPLLPQLKQYFESLPSNIKNDNSLKFILQHLSHYHEPPVLLLDRTSVSNNNSDNLLQILTFIPLSELLAEKVGDENNNSSGIIAINKPQSIPVHSCGKYHKHTVEYLFKVQQNSSSSAFFPCHRLDKGTSGVLFIATDGKTAKTVGDILMEKSGNESELRQQLDHNGGGVLANSKVQIQKEYLARVHGKITEEYLESLKLFKTVFVKDEDDDKEETQKRWFVIDCPIYESPTRKGFFHCLSEDSKEKYDDGDAIRTSAKWAVTLFRIFKQQEEDKNTTLLACRPITGRTHQIRVHLAQVLKHPIVEDDVYDSITAKISKSENNDDEDDVFVYPGKDFPLRQDECKTCLDLLLKSSSSSSSSGGISLKQQLGSFGSPRLNLHSFRYYVNKMIIEAPLPSWA